MLQHYYVFKFFFQNPLNMILKERAPGGGGVGRRTCLLVSNE
jgi:hypothetical protein